MRHYSWQDQVINSLLLCIRTIGPASASKSARSNPAEEIPSLPLTPQEIKQSASLMRVNHAGEVCAQALYLGQSLTTQNVTLRSFFHVAATEEADHLQWCNDRLKELGSHKSILDPLWFTGSLLIGTFAGCFGDRFSLGFLAETENQVFSHLSSHLDKLPLRDHKSRAIVLQMRQDEAKHALSATAHGAAELPMPVKTIMRCMSKVMTYLAALL